MENAVGFLRRNLGVPEPEAATLAGLNEVLLARCDALATTKHYRKGLTLGELFAQVLCVALFGGEAVIAGGEAGFSREVLI